MTEKFYVSYRVSGHKGPGPNGEFCAGPYPDEDEARTQSDDIRGWEGVSHVWIFGDGWRKPYGAEASPER